MDTIVFRPGPREEARSRLGSDASPLIAFTSSAGISDERKGWSYLQQAMVRVKETFPNAQVMVIGHSDPHEQARVSGDVLWMGEVGDNETMAALLQSADVIAVPSTADNLPMTACEAQTCGRAVVAFDVGGLADTVAHQESGYLAAPFDTDDFAEGLILAIEDSRTSNSWGKQARMRAESLWEPATVVRQYEDLYAEVLS